ncbi:hypothetical protein [Legionella maioricensis]|uniref:Uncharacterized protein n=1 Tax=Legionella maioricensis TaxID=2896528 RepID=A0A9X2IBT0_9GAMM|nr:hypothetical protein [Legionella maioricensis]MCL9684546.1 hypothetical protein [Legionella maioricensis]MCL9687860.1 hypothetical protein [Legionella maioricensis]
MPRNSIYDVTEVRKYLNENRDFFVSLTTTRLNDPQLKEYTAGLIPLLYRNRLWLTKESSISVIYRWRTSDFEPALNYEEIRTFIVDNKELVEPYLPVSRKAYTTIEHSQQNTTFNENADAIAMADLSMMVIGGFIAAAGMLAVVIAFAVLNAATFGIPGVVVASVGIAASLSGMGLFAAGGCRGCQAHSEPSFDISDNSMTFNQL